ncbi:redoxin domain-containing protein [Sphingomonas colocasiae]|uniref:Redoxin domain-containing protein n=1 Tax=Sphingomonas colocasiae TaxID=1848973 RepID=A0ABS7PMP2_9SPHN|nr:redoxin domain-containing protein [Sphingomonas colocasiae]MBY8822496.1 redoxin domain-containing protein [Sphingomonas colocasiae]
MTLRYWIGGTVAAAVAVAAPLLAEQTTGAKAGNFRLNDASGKVVELSQFAGKTVVLEWHNPGCPFVQKHYDSGNMQKTQAAARAQGAVWLTINSGAPGKQGFMSGAEAQKLVATQGAKSSYYLLDPKGVVGKGYGAKTTPHMYVIAPDGTLVYQGGIDDKPTANKADIAAARNHVLAALGEVKAGKPVSVKEARPYGCSVKYEGVS